MAHLCRPITTEFRLIVLWTAVVIISSLVARMMLLARNSSADGRAGIQLFAKSVLNYFLLTNIFNVEYHTRAQHQ
jgi:hypothetical protein